MKSLISNISNDTKIFIAGSIILVGASVLIYQKLNENDELNTAILNQLNNLGHLLDENNIQLERTSESLLYSNRLLRERFSYSGFNKRR